MIPADFRSRLNRYFVFAAVLTAAFSVFLIQWVRFCLAEDLFSYTLIIPCVSIWLIWQQRQRLRYEYAPAAGMALAVLVLGIGLLALSFIVPGSDEGGSAGGALVSFRTLSFALLLLAGSLFLLGGRFVGQLLFPMMFLLFMAPFPPSMVHGLEITLQNASAEVSGWFFTAASVPHLQDGRVFQLPNITIEVAQECSGIRSTIVLFITGLVAAYLFLQKNWQRAMFCALIIPLGIARNAFRIVTIGWLCTNYGPEMIHSPIHHRGGPVFFALSLVPLFLLLWMFKQMNRREVGRDAGSETETRGVERDECAPAVKRPGLN